MGAAVVARGNAAPVLEATEHVLDLVPPAISGLVVRDRHFPALRGRDAWLDASFTQIAPGAIAVVTAIANQVASGGQAWQQQGCALVVTHLTFGGSIATGRPCPSQTACSFEFRPPLVRPIRRAAPPF
ncbi:hypothetical protein P792_13440 [Asaia sp. SF2.1]|nr:hypothetical protein P792_13440 [Asaia sp. SF2.1]